MYPVTDRFLDAVTRSHTAVVVAQVHDRTLNQYVDLRVLDGSVTIDRTADVNRTVTLTLVDDSGSLTVDDADDLLAPFGNELLLYRGVRFGPDDEELVPLGVFRLTDWDAADGPDGMTMSVSASDRSLVVQRATWEDPYVVVAGLPVEQAITDLLVDRYPGVAINLPSMVGTSRRLVLDGTDGDPWNDARQIAQGAGWELKFDAGGTVVAVLPTTPSSTPAVTYVEDEQAVLLDLRRGVSTAANVHNGVIATAENTDLVVPLRSLAVDDDPTSRTYYYGLFGKVPRRWHNPLATTQGQLDAGAQTLLDGILGANEDVSWRSITNPALDDNDVVNISRSRAGLDAVPVVLDVVQIPLTADAAMSSSGRRRFL